MARNYGGAYDIDPEMYFTKEEIDEFAYDVCDDVESKFDGHTFKVEDVYIETNKNKDTLFIELCADHDFVVSVSHDIDMRTIRKPMDINKMEPTFVYVFVRKFEELFNLSEQEN